MEKTENEIIAEFMGWKQSDGLDGVYHRGQWYNDECEHLPEGEELQYHTSWDWLMPVVEKIVQIPSISITIKPFTVEHGDRSVSVCSIDRLYWIDGKSKTENISYRRDFIPLIENVYMRVIEFIKWHNTFYCADWNRVGTKCEQQCKACKKAEDMPEVPQNNTQPKQNGN